jgi:catechol 2,3-dioxygenase-like lactoylglutathione lyase family enzyme
MSVTASRVYHVNVNCSDVEGALAFYRDRLGFTAGAHTAPTTVQPGAAFGLDRVQWDAWIMHGAAGPVGPVIDLLEWRVPRPVGRPPSAGTAALGFTGLLVSSPVDGAEERRADPDGTALTVTPADEVALTGVTVGCSDVLASTHFYSEVLGFTRAPTPHDRITLKDGSGAFTVELHPQPPGAAPAAPSANRRGIYRMAMLTEAIDDDHRRLLDEGVRCYSEPATLDMGPGLPTLRALFFADPDGTTMELIEVPRA